MTRAIKTILTHSHVKNAEKFMTDFVTNEEEGVWDVDRSVYKKVKKTRDYFACESGKQHPSKPKKTMRIEVVQDEERQIFLKNQLAEQRSCD